MNANYPQPDPTRHWQYPDPQPPQKKKRRWPWIAGGTIAAFVVVGACSAAIAPPAPTQPLSDTASGQVPPPVAQQIPAPPVPDGIVPDLTSGGAGDTLVSDGLAVTAQGLKSQTWAGMKITCSEVTYQNGSTEEKSFNGLFDWKIQDPAGVIRNTSIGGDDTLSSGQLAPGGTVTGNVCFDPGPAGDYTLTMEPLSLFSSESLMWKLPVS